MKVYKLNHKANGYATVDMDFDVISIMQQESWSDLKKYKDNEFPWIKEDDDNLGECPFYIGALPIFSNRIISELIAVEPSIKHIPIFIEGKSFGIVFTDNVIGGSLNIKSSKVTKFPDGRIMSIEKYVLNRMEYPVIFRLKEYNLHTFVNEHVANVLSSLDVEDLLLEEVSIK